MTGLALLIILAATGIFFYYRAQRGRKKQIEGYMLPAHTVDILNTNVTFYQKLGPAEQEEFRERLRDFLARTTITGVGGVQVEDLDRILVASSAIIPIFRFKGWRYNNISEVLLYPGTFSKNYSTEERGRNILGMVGDGALHRQMILSQPALRQGFTGSADGNNTGIHEFVHLLDKADGATDGVPEYLLGKEYVIPWLQEMRQQIQSIRADHSDLNPYAGTNEAEFLAVTATYFFEQPEKLEEHHPELYRLLRKMFLQESD